tara:strand:- start:119 stop:427 length:309 start_codon:yes stop_codon:yes gene_type:complete
MSRSRFLREAVYDYLKRNPIAKKDAVTKTELADRVGFELDERGMIDDAFLIKHPHNPNSPKADKDPTRYTLGYFIRMAIGKDFEYYRPHPKYPKRKMVYTHD